MKLETHIQLATVQSIFTNYKETRKNEHRPHLGGSQIGNECSRALWYQLRHAWTPRFDGRILRLFETGDREEDRIVKNLRDVGVTVWETDPDTGKQIRFEAFGGHFALSLDGVGEGFAESAQPHTLEFKTINTKGFKLLKQKGVEESKPIYWAQCQIGMHLAGIDRCYFIAVCKETDDIYGERIKLDKAEALKLLAKAERIVFAAEPPARLSEDASFFMCKFCSYWAVCHGCKIPEVSCRSCSHVTPEPDGTWSCGKGWETDIPCDDHLFIPSMMPKGFSILDASPDHVEYADEEGEILINKGNSRDLFEGRMK